MLPTMTKIEGQRFNSGKPATHLLPAAALIEVAKVFEFGAQKYCANNYRKGLPWSTYVGSGLRHLWDWYAGEELDPESGLHHLAHLGCNVLMALDAVIYGHGDDDRWEANRKKEKASETVS